MVPFDRAKRFVGHFVYQIGIYLSIIVPCVVFSCILDRWTFNQWTVDQWNFIKFNFLFGGSGVYGVQPWHWYLSQGFTAMLLTQTPLVIIFIVMYFIFGPRLMRNLIIRKKTDYSKNSSNHLLSDPCGLCIVVIGWTVFWYSLLPHKEFRFIFPLIPLANYFAGIISVWFIRNGFRLHFPKSQHTRRQCLIWFIISTHIPLALYVCLVHQRGGLDAIKFLNQQMKNKLENEIAVVNLMPCHTVPSIGHSANEF
ncbi:GPI mannosyltransferase 3 [Schistosoma japonicum]|nr:GPI mannosyltransferase 3 [Schistosoma japonicum]KAH8865810.1 GPI mannosyltransferase 3 [Schistosoma japonicum]KAH8865814.1 GPI mannosyltransferase 3 [Schistosoma japonicum]KAH8865823.1 GPI mannosyltransferase 3 [Schistosoma japonicum]